MHKPFAESLLYRRGNFNGTFDQVLCDAMTLVNGNTAADRKSASKHNLCVQALPTS